MLIDEGILLASKASFPAVALRVIFRLGVLCCTFAAQVKSSSKETLRLKLSGHVAPGPRPVT